MRQLARFSMLRLFVFAVALTLCSGSVVAKQTPLKVLILVGQSNMQGHARIRTLPYVGMDPKTAPILKKIQKDDGTPRVCKDVWVSYLSSAGEKQGQMTTGFGADEDKIGPELTFGIYMHEILDEPILIIKTAWGGKSLHTDFRPPSAGAFEFDAQQLERFKQQGKDVDAIKADKVKATGQYYRLMIGHVKKVLADIKQVYPDYDPDQGYQLAGFVWFQGWNDMVDRGVYPKRDQPGGYDQYSEVLAHFIRDVRKDLDAPHLPFVIGVMGVGGPTDKYLPEQLRYQKIHQNFRDAMAAPAGLPEFKENVATVLTENYWDMELLALRARDAKIKQQVKQLRSAGKLSREEEKAALQKYRGDEFTERELTIMETGVSNFEFHYLGSAKILAQIGKGFAERAAELLQRSQN